MRPTTRNNALFSITAFIFASVVGIYGGAWAGVLGALLAGVGVFLVTTLAYGAVFDETESSNPGVRQ